MDDQTLNPVTIEVVEGLSNAALSACCRELANQLAADEPEVCIVLAVAAKRLAPNPPASPE